MQTKKIQPKTINYLCTEGQNGQALWKILLHFKKTLSTFDIAKFLL